MQEFLLYCRVKKTIFAKKIRMYTQNYGKLRKHERLRHFRDRVDALETNHDQIQDRVGALEVDLICNEGAGLKMIANSSAIRVGRRKLQRRQP